MWSKRSLLELGVGATRKNEASHCDMVFLDFVLHEVLCTGVGFAGSGPEATVTLVRDKTKVAALCVFKRRRQWWNDSFTASPAEG